MVTDGRRRAAVDASIGWYEDICAMHGVGSDLRDSLWCSRQAPPPLHSDAVVVEPVVRATTVFDRLADRVHCGVKDSFATLDLSRGGFEVLFHATWLYCPTRSQNRRAHAEWSAVTSATELAIWNDLHDTAGVLLPALLQRAHFRVLAKRVDGRVIAGAVARLGTAVVDVSNVFAVPGHQVDWAELADVVTAQFPDRPLVGYERGEELAAAQHAGFDAVGDLQVWTR